MPSDFLSPFVELDDALCKTFLNLRVDDDRSPARKAPPGYQRTFSACPVISSGSCFSSSEHLEDVAAADPLWPPHGHWRPDAELPHTSLQRIPFQGDRSVSMIEDGRGAGGEGKAPSSRYKTELCRTFEESGTCKYGGKCQFAHGAGELRGLSRHPKYKTEPCRTFHTAGFCPYGARCHFIHNAEERRPLPLLRCSLLLHPSLSCGGCPSTTSPPLASHPPEPFFPCDSLSLPSPSTAAGGGGATPTSPFAFPGLLLLQRSLSADSLSDQEDSGSSGGSSGSESPGLGAKGHRLPIFSRLSVSDD